MVAGQGEAPRPMQALAWVSAKRLQTRPLARSHGFAHGRWLAWAGGRVDVKREIEDFNIVASLTDNTLRDYEAAPWLKEALVTADKKISSAPHIYPLAVVGDFCDTPAQCP